MKMRCRNSEFLRENGTSISTSTGPEYLTFHSNMERNFAKRGEIIDKPSHRGIGPRRGRLNNLLVGVSHQKYVKGPWSSTKVNCTDKSYLSASYALEPTPPYRIVARSGWFGLATLAKRKPRKTIIRTYLMRGI
jgi:hypothetical protein